MNKKKFNPTGTNPAGNTSDFNKPRYTQYNKDIFIAIVRHVVDEESDILESLRGVPENLLEYVDNRNVAYITPIDSNFSNSLVTAYFINSHDIDYPLKGEAVLCVNTELGNIIIDRLSMYGYGINYDVMDYIQQSERFIDNPKTSESIELEKNEDIIRENIEKVAPFFSKKGSRTVLGRNNQYLIMDMKARSEASENVKEYTDNGKFLKLGFRDSGNQHDDRKDSQIVFTKDALLQYMMEGRIPSGYNVDPDDEPDEGIGIQSDEVILRGNRFVVIYSKQDLLVKAKNIYFESDLFELNSKRVNLQKDASNPVVKSKELRDALDQFSQLVNNLMVATPTGPAPLDPSSKTNVQRFRNRYVMPQNPPYASRKSFTE